MPGWIGLDIKVQGNVVVVENTIGYVHTLDSPTTDLKTAYQVLSRTRGCEIRERLQLKRLHVSLTRHFMAKQWRFTGSTRHCLMD